MRYSDVKLSKRFCPRTPPPSPLHSHLGLHGHTVTTPASCHLSKTSASGEGLIYGSFPPAPSQGLEEAIWKNQSVQALGLWGAKHRQEGRNAGERT